MNSLSLATTVPTELKIHTLKKGSLIAAVGIFILIFGGTQLSKEQLANFGVFVFFISLACIAWGLIPYRKLCQLELFPHTLVIDESALIYRAGRKIESWKREDIASILYEAHSFAIILEMKKGLPPKQLPFFSHRSYERLKNYTNASLRT